LKQSPVVLSERCERRIFLSEETIVIAAVASMWFFKDRTIMRAEVLVSSGKEEGERALVWHFLANEEPEHEIRQKLRASAEDALEGFVDLLIDALKENPDFESKLARYIVWDDPFSLVGPNYARLAIARRLSVVLNRLRDKIRMDAVKVRVPFAKVAEALGSGAPVAAISDAIGDDVRPERR